MNKRGEVTSAQIIAIVLVILGFAVVLAFIYGFKSSINLNDDVCKFSVVGRATAQNVIGGIGEYVPLKCTTKKICISDSLFGGSCSQFNGETDVQTVQLSGSSQQKIEIVEDISAQAMYDCWNMMGQGKLDLVSNAKQQLGWDSSKSTCVVCSRVALADNVGAYVKNGIDMNRYLATHQVPGSSLTYLQTFTDSGINAFPAVSKEAYTSGLSNGNANTLSSLQAAVVEATNNLNQINADSKSSDAQKQEAKNNLDQANSALHKAVTDTSSKLDSGFSRNEIAFVFMQIKADSLGQALSNQLSIGGAVAGSSFMIAPSATFGTAKTVFNVLGGKVAGILSIAAAAGDVGYTAYNTYESQTAAGGYCGTFTSADSAKQGCSIVQILPYSFKDISNLCQIIQGSP